MLTHFSFT